MDWLHGASFFIACVYKVRRGRREDCDSLWSNPRKVSTDLNVGATYTVFDAEKEEEERLERKKERKKEVSRLLDCFGEGDEWQRLGALAPR